MSVSFTSRRAVRSLAARNVDWYVCWNIVKEKSERNLEHHLRSFRAHNVALARILAVFVSECDD